MADKTLKSLNFGGVDNYFPLPLVTAADNDKILSVVNGEWAVIDFPGNSGEYVWSRQYAGSSVTGDFTGGTYTLTTTNNTQPSSEIEYSASAPTYNIATKKWEMADSTIVTLTNADTTVPSFSGNMYVRLTSAPNVWYLATAINVTGSGPYAKSLAYSAKYTAAIDNSYVEYVAGATEGKYPDGGWVDGAYCKLILSAKFAIEVVPKEGLYLGDLGFDVVSDLNFIDAEGISITTLPLDEYALIISYLEREDGRASEEIRMTLQEAHDSISSIETFNELGIYDILKDEISKFNNAPDINDMAIRDLTYISLNGEALDYARAVNTQIAFNIQIPADAPVVIIRLIDGEWYVIPIQQTQNQGDGTVLVTFDCVQIVTDGIGAFAFVVPENTIS